MEYSNCGSVPQCTIPKQSDLSPAPRPGGTLSSQRAHLMPTDGDPSAAPPARPSWQEREIALALQRLASARVRVASLEEQLASPAATVAAADPADIDRVEALQAEIVKLQPKASSRFGGGNARHRIDELLVQQRLVLERLGFDSYDAYHAVGARPDAAPAVDPDVMAFAVAEFESAQQAFLDVSTMVIADADPDDEVFERRDVIAARHDTVVTTTIEDNEQDADVIPLVKPQAS